jgi:DNA-binding response OmpR family regulator
MTDDASTILVVEDDAATRTFLADNLIADGYDVVVGATAVEGRAALESHYPDLVVLDVGLPDGTGFDVLAGVREADGVASRVDPRTPVLVLSGRASELDRIRGFERGADDYLCKPFSYPELRHRVDALLRRAQDRSARGRMRVGGLDVDPAAREVRLHGELVALSQKEFALVRALAGEPTRVFTKDELMRTIWGYRHLGQTRTLDSHACRLRKKLGAAGEKFVVNVWGVGYRLCDGAVEA